MENGYLFKTARACALVSLLWPTLVPLVQAESDELPPVDSPLDVSETPGRRTDFLEIFWQLAWGIDFIPGRSGMFLADSLGEDLWLVMAGDSAAENPVVAEGLFLEAHREALDYLDWPEEQLEDAGLLSVNHSFVAGSIFAPTGFQSPLVAMIVEIVTPGENPDDDPILSQIIAPFALMPDVETAIVEISILASLYDAGPDTYVGELPNNPSPFGQPDDWLSDSPKPAFPR